MSQEELSEQQREKKTLEEDIIEYHKTWKNLRRTNSQWDAGLTVSTIFLTLALSILGLEGVPVSETSRKIWIGVLGTVTVSIQAIGNAFPVKQRSGGYKTLESQAWTLRSKIKFLQTDEEICDKLPGIQEQFYELVSRSADLET
jgi:hypothetical protein